MRKDLIVIVFLGLLVRIIGASGTGQDIADTTSGRVYHDGTNVVAV